MRPTNSTQTSILAQLLECAIESVYVHFLAVSSHKKRSVILMGAAKFTTPVYVVAENLSCHWTKRHETGLEEFRVVNPIQTKLSEPLSHAAVKLARK